MRITYFGETDTALLTFTDRPVADSRAIGENVVLDLDADGNLVAMTIEHAARTAKLPEVSFTEVAPRSEHHRAE